MKLTDYLSEQGVDFELKHHEEYYTAQEEAAAQHISGHKFAKTVVVKAGGEYVLLVLPASYRVDLEKVGTLLETEVELAREKDLAELFPDCELGAEPPFGSLYGLRTVVDEHLAAQKKIAVRACSHEEVALLRFEDFARLEKPRIASFAEPEGGGFPGEPTWD